MINPIDLKEDAKIALYAADTPLDQVGATICAMLNSGGGSIILGITPEKVLEGIDDPETLQANLRHFISYADGEAMPALLPQAYWSISTEAVEERTILVMHVPAGAYGPYSFGGTIYVRKGKHTKLAGPSEASELINKRFVQASRWEHLPAVDANLDDLEIEEVLKTASLAATKRFHTFQDSEDPLNILADLNLLLHGQVTNSAVVLFGKTPTRFFPQTRTRVTVYRGNKTNLEVGLDKTFEGNLFHLYESVTGYVSQQIPVISELTAAQETRRDEPQYPYWSVREGIRNALIHRDYASFSGGLTIGIYPERIEIWNYGRLPEGLSIRDLKRDHPSLPTNPDIAHIFFLRGIIEKLGRGTQRIVEEFNQAGLPSPKWEEHAGGIRLTLIGRKRDRSPSERINERQFSLLKRYEPGERVSVSRYLKELKEDISERTAREDLARLTGEGYFVRQGKGRSTIYIRTEKKID